MRNALRIIVLCFLFASIALAKSYGQIQSLSSHYYLNQLSVNPAAAGSEGGVNIFLNYRGQWVGITGSPNTQNFAADMSLPMINSGAGITVSNDLVGAERHTTIRANFAYFLDINKEYKIGFGIAGGIVNSSIDGSKLVTPQGEDDFLPNVKTTSTQPDLAFGTYIKSKHLRAGVSYNNVLRKASFEGVNNTLETKYGSYLNIFGAYELFFNEKFSLEPSVQVRTDFKNYQTDIGALFSYNNFIFTGVFVRGYNKLSIDAFYGTVGFKPIGSLSVFYSYDLGLSTLNDVHNGSHEISINVSIPEQKLFKRGKIIYNPRYL